jgi:hypothetical protein
MTSITLQSEYEKSRSPTLIIVAVGLYLDGECMRIQAT